MAVSTVDLSFSMDNAKAATTCHTDIEVRVVQALGEYASSAIAESYANAKRSSRVLGFIATTTETVLSKSGVVAVVGFFYTHYKRLGSPIVNYLDEAMGRRIFNMFVRLLLVVEHQQKNELAMAKPGSLQLTYHERIQALLNGHVPRLQALIMELRKREAQAAENARKATPVVVMDPQDYVRKDELIKAMDQNRATIAEKHLEVASLNEKLTGVECERQQLESELSSVRDDKRAEDERHAKDLAEKESELDALKNKVQEAELARSKLEDELIRVRLHQSAERERRYQLMQGKLQDLKQELSDKNIELDSLQAMVEEAQRQPKSNPSSPTSSIASLTDENQPRNSIERERNREKAKKAVRRLFGAMPPTGKF